MHDSYINWVFLCCIRRYKLQWNFTQVQVTRLYYEHSNFTGTHHKLFYYPWKTSEDAAIVYRNRINTLYLTRIYKWALVKRLIMRKWTAARASILFKMAWFNNCLCCCWKVDCRHFCLRLLLITEMCTAWSSIEVSMNFYVQQNTHNWLSLTLPFCSWQ